MAPNGQFFVAQNRAMILLTTVYTYTMTSLTWPQGPKAQTREPDISKTAGDVI